MILESWTKKVFRSEKATNSFESIQVEAMGSTWLSLLEPGPTMIFQSKYRPKYQNVSSFLLKLQTFGLQPIITTSGSLRRWRYRGSTVEGGVRDEVCLPSRDCHKQHRLGPTWSIFTSTRELTQQGPHRASHPGEFLIVSSSSFSPSTRNFCKQIINIFIFFSFQSFQDKFNGQ